MKYPHHQRRTPFFLMGLIALGLLLLCSASPSSAQSPGELDLSFDAGSTVDNEVLTVLPANDGKIYVSGNFTTVRGAVRSRIARLNADGTVDTSFNPGTGADGSVSSMALQADGKLLIGGVFTNYNNTQRNRIARINPDGSLDASFNPGSGFNEPVHSIAIQPDGKAIIAGDFTSYNGTVRNRILRLDADGSLDSGFNTGSGASSTVRSLALQADGKVLIGGDFSISANGESRYSIARINTDGGLDTSFNFALSSSITVNCVAVQPDGKVLIGGDFGFSIGGQTARGILRLNENGSRDGSFSPGTGATSQVLSSAVRSVILQSNGKILIGGDFTQYNGTTRNRIARINADGSLDTSFNPGTGTTNSVLIRVNSVATRMDGRILIAGNFRSYNGTTRDRIASLNEDGGLDGSFNPTSGLSNEVRSVSIQSDGKIIVAGDFTTYGATTRNRILRLNTDGSLDTSFDPGQGANGIVYSAVVQSDGKVVIGGEFTNYGGTGRRRIVRLTNSGSLDAGFLVDDSWYSSIECMALQPDGKILIAGRDFIDRLNTDGSSDAGFEPAWPDGTVKAIAVQTDGRILIGGSIPGGIARLHTDGSVDTTFNSSSGTNRTVYSLALSAEDKILVGGSFSTYNGMDRNNIVRLNADGSVDTGFNPGTGANNTIWSVLRLQNGKAIIAGDFTVFNGIDRMRITRLNEDGSLDHSFNPGTGANGRISALTNHADIGLLIGGAFSIYNNSARGYLARISSASSPLPQITMPTSQVITESTAVLGGTVSSDGGSVITGRGVVYSLTSTNPDPAIGGAGVVQTATSGSTGPFTVSISGLSPATSYSFKAYATNSEGTSYTAAAGFTTPPYLLTTTAAGGTILRSPDLTSYAFGTEVTLTALPSGDSSFQGWSGDLSGSSNPTTIIMNGNKSVTALFAPSLAGALDTPGRSYTLGGNANWFAQTTVTHDGIDAARSGAIGNSQQTWFETTVTGPGTLSFWWKVSSESGWDHLEFYINGSLQAGRISGEVNWQQKTYELSSGNHVLRWRYAKDGSVSVGSDAGWVDEVVWTPSGGFGSWLLLATLPPDRRGPLDRNGPLQIQNLLTYAMGLDPLTAIAADLPSVSSVDPAAGHATFRYRRAKNAPGVTLTPMTSTTLDGWQPAQVLQTTIIQDGGDWEVVEVRVSYPPDGRLFFQLKAE